MPADLLSFLLRCAAINYAILILWFVVFVFAHDWIYRMHSRWFRLAPDTFDALNYLAIAIYKIGIIGLLIVPAIALYWARS
jgi:hypothetical protein